MTDSTRQGFLYGLAAYVWWGLVPIYFHWLGATPPLLILAHRIVWSAVFLAIILTLARRWSEMLRCLATAELLLPLSLSAVLVAFNWLMYILGVHHKIVVQASLGYFILPLMNVLLALVIFREHLRPLQHYAIACACAGVVWMTVEAGTFPWLALSLAVSFSFYGMIRKKVPVDGLVGVAVETVVLLPVAAGYLMFHYVQTTDGVDALHLGKLSLSGVVTAVPLLCFGQAARRLPFATLGFLQYISPIVQFLLAVYLLREPVLGGWVSFALIWTALLIFSIDSFRFYHRSLQAPVPPDSLEPLSE